MRYKFFNNSEKSWGAMYEAIKNASSSVYLEMYIFNDDMDTYNFVKLLKEKAQNGIRIRIILDSLGSRDLSKKSIALIKESGAEIFFISHFFHHTHRKILVIDEQIAFIGGVNFTKHASHWDDLVVLVHGKIVINIIRTFAKSYVECGGKDPKILAQHKLIILDKTRTWLIEQFPMKKVAGLKSLYKKHIGHAKNHIVIVTPYFMPTKSLVASLHQAVLRGVKVEVIVPRHTDHAVVIDRVNYFFMSKLSQLGVIFFLEPKMNHAKAMIVDDHEAIVGSHNLDFLSFDYNNEIGVFIMDQRAVKQLKGIIEKWKRESIQFNSKIDRPNYLYYLLSPFIRLFAGII